MNIVTCSHDRHAQPILDILNEAIVSSTALYDYEPRSIESMRKWFDAKLAGRFPVIGVEDEKGVLAFTLMRELIVTARVQGYHTLIGAIDSDNAASIALHEKLGFQHGGTIRQAGFKFGRWLDVAFYQLLLDTPAAPQDG